MCDNYENNENNDCHAYFDYVGGGGLCSRRYFR